MENPARISEYRPINLLNNIQSYLTVIARLKLVIERLLVPNQSTFIPGRALNDNVILSHKIVKGYRRQGISKSCMVKIDMKKTCDSLKWTILEQVLEELKMPTRFIKWIMQCVTIVTYPIQINGRSTTRFKIRRGIRPGNPMSPYLFVLAMDYLTRFFRRFQTDPNFHYHPRCKAQKIV